VFAARIEALYAKYGREPAIREAPVNALANAFARETAIADAPTPSRIGSAVEKS
jgi:hypothetical protein